MHRHIIVFGAGKSATHLIKYLLHECAVNKWRLTVADSDPALAQSKVGRSSFAAGIHVNVQDEKQRAHLIAEADLVISLLPPSLHYLVAMDCLQYGKNLLTASYLDEKLIQLSVAIKNKGLLFLCEMGLDPGIDHMSAMSLVHRIKDQGGTIVSFKSHCGGLLAPESDDNPWHYKISWNPRNIVRAGSSGSIFKENDATVHVEYDQLFYDCKEIYIPGLNRLAYYPNRDSLHYMKLYELESAGTFIRTTLRYPAYCSGWNCIVRAGLTNDSKVIHNNDLTIKKWAEGILPFIDSNNRGQFEFLGFFDDQSIPLKLKTSADILQWLLEEKLMMQPPDKDMIVMLHEIDYLLDNKLYTTNSLLMVKGEDNINTAMAKTVGLPLGIAASLILKQKISLTGLHIPVSKDIYIPVLKELELQGISFDETTFTS